LLAGLLATFLSAAAGRGQPVLPAPTVEEAPPPRTLPAPAGTDAAPPGLTLADALRWAVERNPGLATIRKQHGIAAAGIVIADTYPFNPIVQDFVWGANGPLLAGVTNHVFNEHTMRLDLELRGQGTHRRAMAKATLSRTDWEIAAQEVIVAVQVVRAFNTALHRRERLRVQEDTVTLQEGVVNMVGRLVEQGNLPRTELMLARLDLADAQAAVGPARNLLVVGENDLRRLLGLVEESISPQGTLEYPLPRLAEADMVREAAQRRPDLHALESAVRETEANLRLQVANRFGNPSLGPAFEYNETSVNFVGMWLLWQVPVLNTGKGLIMQRQAERARALQAVQSLTVTLRQDVQAALKRLASAAEVVEAYRTQTFPALRSTREGLDQMFARGEPGVTLARVIAIRSRLLVTRAAYLDALLELAQARADLAAAVGDPSLALPGPPLCADDKVTR
jgi:cobalt-zinc-cadmium efflux system outer membrane protein